MSDGLPDAPWESWESHVVYTVLRHNFEVTAECAWGYEGTPSAAVCSGPNQPYTMDAWLS